MKGWGAFFSSAVICAVLGFSSETYAQASPPPVEARLGQLETKVEELEQKIKYRNFYLALSAVFGLIGVLTGGASLISSRRNRKADRKIKAFETNYEGGILSALQLVETCASDLSAAAELPVPDSRVNEVETVWVSALTPALNGLSEQLLRLDESAHVAGNEWAAVLDNPLDRFARSVDILLNEKNGNKAIFDAAKDFCAAARELSESVRTKLIEHKNSLG